MLLGWVPLFFNPREFVTLQLKCHMTTLFYLFVNSVYINTPHVPCVYALSVNMIFCAFLAEN